jgi:hypothetical protein
MLFALLACGGTPTPGEFDRDGAIVSVVFDAVEDVLDADAQAPSSMPPPDAQDGPSPIPCDRCAYHTICQAWDIAPAFYGCNAGGRCLAAMLATTCPDGCVPTTQGSCP